MNPIQLRKRQVKKFILDTYQGISKAELYKSVAEHFGTHRKNISKYYRELEESGQLTTVNDLPPVQYTDGDIKKILSQTGENMSVSLNLDYEIRTLDQLLEACDVDVTKWEVVSWQCGKHELGIKNASKELEKTQLFSVKARFKQITPDNNVPLQKDVILEELYKKSPIKGLIYRNPDKDTKKYLLELCLFDMHFGKLAHKEESGDDYDLKIAAKRYNAAINDFLDRVPHKSIERILFPIGNDMINIDSAAGLTTAGTPQDSDSRFYKIVRTVKNLLITTITMLEKIAPVDVVVCVGNHDTQTSFLIGEMIDAYFHNDANVTVDNNAALRKYYSYGATSILFTHGDKEKHANLGMIFAAEAPKLWASTKQRYIQVGHFHHNKKIEYLSNQEFQGFQIQILPSLSGSDAWHAGKGFNSLKQAKAFLFSEEKGLVSELTYTV